MTVAFSSLSIVPHTKAGKRLALPGMPKRATHFVRNFIELTGFRLRFLSLWMRRGLGIVQPRTLDAALLEEGLTLVLPGIESESVFTYGMCDGLQDGGLKGAIGVFDWGLPFPGGYFSNLTRIDRNRRRAGDIAALICDYQDHFPGRPVNIVAQSGGGGVAIFAAEALPPGRSIDRIVLLGAALSPSYDLSRALAATREGILNSYSKRDSIVLGWGTRIFGTTDRKFTAAAGSQGFHMPDGLGAEGKRLYDEKLVQLEWCQEMAEHGTHWGGHICCGSETYLAAHIAPWLQS